MTGIIDTSTEFGARAARRLQDDLVVWMTTVNAKRAPVPSPVWFLSGDDDEVVVYSQLTQRIKNIASDPLVTLNFDGNGSGGDIVIFSGTARIDDTLPSADRNEAYVRKYGSQMGPLGFTPESFGVAYEAGLRIKLTALRGH
jgi:PPOX class probable F420-dependent enzyme